MMKTSLIQVRRRETEAQKQEQKKDPTSAVSKAFLRQLSKLTLGAELKKRSTSKGAFVPRSMTGKAPVEYSSELFVHETTNSTTTSNGM